jgi:regulatory protein
MRVPRKADRHRITKIEVQKRTSRRVSVYLDGSFALGVDALVAQEIGLHEGMELSQGQLENLVLAEEKSRARNFALDFIGYRARSVWEVRERLTKRKHSQEAIEQVITELLQGGLLDDVKFAARWAQGRMATKPLGGRLLRQELRLKGVADAIVEKTIAETFAQVSPGQLATDLLRARRKRYAGLPWAKARRRMADFLLRRGFSRDIVWQSVDRAMGEGDWDEGRGTI